MRMRWVLTWRRQPDSTQKGKARLVVLGYTAPDLLEVETASSTPSRRARNLFYVKAAEHNWTTYLADVSTTFLQSNKTEEHRNIFA